MRNPPLPEAADPVTALYRTFLRERDLPAFRDGLAAEIALLERYPGIVRRLDVLAGLPEMTP